MTDVLELDYAKENELNIEQEDVWEVIRACFVENGIVQYQIRAFDHFLDYELQEIVNNAPDIIYDPNTNDKNIKDNRIFDKISKLKFGNVSIVKPIDEFTLEPILPYEARTRNLYYCADIYIELIKETENINPELENPKSIKNKVKFGSIPMLVGSKYCNLSNMSLEEKAAIAHECPYDKGGYFISNGSEKAIVSQERMNINTPCVFKGKMEEHYYIEVRTISKDSTMSWIRIEYIAGNIYAYIEPSFKAQKIPLIVLFRALGVNNIEDIIHLVYRKNEPRIIYDSIKSNLSNIKLNNEITDKEKAINYLGAMTTHKNTLAIMHKYLLSHMGENETSDIPKAFYIGNMINSLLNVSFGFRKQSDRDHYKNKRIDNVGELFTALFRSKFRTLHKDIKKTFQRFIDANTDITDLSNIVKKNAITTALRGPISTGNWGKKKQGVSQPLARYNIISSLSHQRRINTHSEKQSKLVKPRHLHNSQFNLICPSETPEGQSVGLVKNLTMLSTITIHTIKEVLYPILNHNNMIYISETDPYDLYKYTKIFINGEWVGNCEEPEVLVKQLRYYRRLNTLARETSITYNKELTTIFIYTNQGRLTRPVFILDEDTMELKLTKKDLELVKDKEFNWSNLIQTGRVEYIDAEESENLLIAISFDEIIASKKSRSLGKHYKHFTHVEMHPSVMLGISASYIPFANHNQAPRNTYQCLDPDSLVLMENNTQLAMKYIKIGDTVKTFNPITLKITNTKVVYHHVSYTEKDIYKITAYTDFSIKATYDHKFMTWYGWKEVCQLDIKKDLIAIYINNDVKFVNIKSIVKIDMNYISDITTESENHSFIAGGDMKSKFLVHNSAMGKQAMGIYALNHKERMDSSGNTLWYPEKALVNTQQADLMKLNELPSGQNIIVAVACYGGYNQEDSLIMNKSSVERGLFRSYTYKTIIVHNKANGGTIDIGVPKIPNKGSDFSKLDSQGIIKVGVEVKENDVIVAKTFFPKENEDDSHEPKDTSRKIVIGEEGFVDNVVVTNDADNNILIKIKLRSMKIPEMGDKFSCYTPDHEILTDKGWVRIDKVTKDNKAYSYDPVTKTANYEDIEEVQLYNITERERLYTLFPENITVTGNHRMYIKKKGNDYYEFITAKEIHDSFNEVHSKYLPVNKSVDIKYYDKYKIEIKNTKYYKYSIFNNETEIEKDYGDLGIRMDYKNIAENYKTVHCITVRTGIIYVRNINKQIPIWCGNSRHGQKGTVGLVMPQENMPFNRYGASPDIIMNPHALPSRMTIAQLLECVVSKAGALKWQVSDGTSFTDVNVDEICDKLANIVMCSYCSSENIEIETKMCKNCETYNEKFFKYERHGNETLYNGFTGEKLEAQIFVGPVYYQRLKHLVANKIHARSRGPTQILTRQPLEGRCRQGGLRLGEMEVNSILGNGSSAFIKGRTFHSSDPFQLPICRNCGYQAIANSIKDIYKCLKCKNSEIHYIDIPYATKLVTQELTAMGMGIRLDINDTYDDNLKPFT